LNLMAKSASRKLKVFQAQFGFYDTVVASSSQVAALKAWGTHQNLFARGDAKLTTDAAAIRAALEHPDKVLRRAIGTNDPFQLEPVRLPAMRTAENSAGEPPTRARRRPPASPRPDRSALDAAEAALRALERNRTREEQEFRSRQGALDTERAEAQSDYMGRRRAAEHALVKARDIYKKSHGHDR
jgi:hypothetical protein